MDSEFAIRIGFFGGIFTLIAIWELLAPRRDLTIPKTVRWVTNFGIILINPLILRLVFPILAMDMAIKAQQNGWGLLNNYNISYWPSLVVGVIALDFVIYFQHIMFHAVPVLWRLHMIHHTDMDYDVTTGLRFHPIEILISMGIKLSAVIIVGPPVISVLIFEVVLNATSMFNHGNIRLPIETDRFLRFFVVTPDMHRVHHSVIPKETNANFGFNFPWWDYLFGTYRNQPAMGHEDMRIGLTEFRDVKKLSLPWLMVLPFIRKKEKSVS
jgi:sterol desaturase/sphingolipid hydroxylase (fatty acid hydroxylase superfamily)